MVLAFMGRSFGVFSGEKGGRRSSGGLLISRYGCRLVLLPVVVDVLNVVVVLQELQELLHVLDVLFAGKHGFFATFSATFLLLCIS